MKKVVVAAVLLVPLALGCTSNQKAGAARGATTGAVRAAARGAVWAGTAGAVGGAMAGSEVDRYEAQQQQAQAEQELMRLQQRIGEDAFSGLAALADCKHGVALAYADSASGSSNSDYSLAGAWLEALTYVDSGRTEEAEVLYPQLAERDDETASAAQAKAKTLEVVEVVRDFREKEGRPRLCK
jgi:hypothetical protein